MMFHSGKIKCNTEYHGWMLYAIDVNASPGKRLEHRQRFTSHTTKEKGFAMGVAGTANQHTLSISLVLGSPFCAALAPAGALVVEPEGI